MNKDLENELKALEHTVNQCLNQFPKAVETGNKREDRRVQEKLTQDFFTLNKVFFLIDECRGKKRTPSERVITIEAVRELKEKLAARAGTTEFDDIVRDMEIAAIPRSEWEQSKTEAAREKAKQDAVLFAQSQPVRQSRASRAAVVRTEAAPATNIKATDTTLARGSNWGGSVNRNSSAAVAPAAQPVSVQMPSSNSEGTQPVRARADGLVPLGSPSVSNKEVSTAAQAVKNDPQKENILSALSQLKESMPNIGFFGNTIDDAKQKLQAGEISASNAVRSVLDAIKPVEVPLFNRAHITSHESNIIKNFMKTSGVADALKDGAIRGALREAATKLPPSAAKMIVDKLPPLKTAETPTARTTITTVTKK